MSAVRKGEPLVAYKEWAPVVAQLACGRQHLLLRKGGIAEGRGGFRPEHEWFWLMPTEFHAAPGKLKPGVEMDQEVSGVLKWAAEVKAVHWLEDWNQVQTLHLWHVWAEEEIRKRFEYGKRWGLFVMLVRVWRAAETMAAPQGPAAAGCRSWIPVMCRGEQEWATVVAEAGFEQMRQELRQITGLDF